MKLSPSKRPFNVSVGERGEMMAWGYLADHGFKFLEKNYRCLLGEIDVVCRKNGLVYFVEIKTRTTDQFGEPQEAVGLAKQRKIIQLAKWYLKERKKENIPVMFSVLAIRWHQDGEPQIRFIENAFEVSGDPR